jgi:iron complex outermembrane receptor protein
MSSLLQTRLGRVPVARAFRRAPVFAFVVAFGATISARSALSAQATRDSSRRDSSRTDTTRTLEGVLVQALRAGDDAPVTRSTITRATITRRNFAQDVPLLLQGAVPSLIGHTETGAPWGYSYLRLRGMDQTRLNLSIDGIPLNDPEDQVFYFANFVDLLSGVQSVDVQRGAGTTGAGTAAFAGSVNFETRPIAAMPRAAAAEVQAGSFNSQRVMLEGSTGLTPRGFAAYARLSGVRTDGFRYNAGVLSGSGLLSAGWFGERQSVKLLALGGVLRDTLAYLAVPVNELRLDRRINPIGPDEQDRFGQRLLGLTYTREALNGARFATTLYRMSASGSYDVRIDPDPVSGLWNFHLDHTWYGVTSAVMHDVGAWRLNAGVNANTYARDHYAWVDGTRGTPGAEALYFNTGHKQDAAAFGKVAYVAGDVTLFGDVQGRLARFRYEPTVGSGVPEESVNWAFLNPRVGLTWQASAPVTLRASLGRTTREPTRSDMFGGADDLDATQYAAIGDFRNVRPEEVTNLEVGAKYTGARGMLDVNVFAMEFRNEIAPIGVLTPLGSALRRNVGESFRRGVELDGQLRVSPRLTVGGNAAWLHARIASFTDETGASPVTYRDVPPLLSPAWLSAQRVEWAASDWLDLGFEGRYQGPSYLRNDGNRATTLPDFYVADATARVRLPRVELTVRGANLGNSQRFASGYAVEGVPNFYVLPPRSVFVTARVGR